MRMSTVIIGLGLLFFTGHFLSWFFEKTKIPDLLILVAIGYTIGPILGLVQPSDFGKVGSIVSTLALIVILYEGGLNLKAKDLLQSCLPAALISVLGFLVTGLIAFVIVRYLAFQSMEIALLTAVGIGSTSSAIVIPMVKYLSIDDRTKTILSLESAFTDVLTIVLFLVLVDGMAKGVMSSKDILIGLGPDTLTAAAFGLFLGHLWAFLKKKFAAILPTTFAGEAWALLSYGVIEACGLNGAIGVLSLGFMLANLDLLPEWMKDQLSRIPVSYGEMSLLSEITFILRTFFFLYLGILIQISNVNTIIIGIVLCLVIFLVRYLIGRVIFSPKQFTRLDAMVVTSMGPRGLACAVLATIPLQRGIAGGEWLRDALFAVIPFSIFLTAVFVSMSESKTIRIRCQRFFKPYEEKGVTAIEESQS